MGKSTNTAKDRIESRARRKRLYASILAALLALIFILGMAAPIFFG